MPVPEDKHRFTLLLKETAQAFGFPADKLSAGVASYGRSFTLKSPSESGLGAPVSGPGQAQQCTRLAGMDSYYEICQIIEQGGVVTQLEKQAVPYVVSGNQWIGYDDQASFQKKVAFVKNNNLGGVALWSLDLDDFAGQFCKSGDYPLIRGLAAALKDNP